MSTVDDDSAGRARTPADKWLFALRVVAAVAAISSLVALWSGESQRVRDDLQLFAEPSARPGETLALRALWLRNVDAPEGPALQGTKATVVLRDREERELARTLLLPSPLQGMEGSITVPSGIAGPLTLEAKLEDKDEPLRCRRTLLVAPDAPTAEPVGRIAGPLQQLSLGPLRAKEGEVLPRPFVPRVLGGSCVPEEVCQLLVWVGEPAARVVVRPSASAELVKGPLPNQETSGLVSIELKVHGVEAEVTLEALRAGVSVAERSLRLPVALGEAGIKTARSLLEPNEPIELSLTAPPGRRHVVVDAYREDRWAFTSTVADATPKVSFKRDVFPKATGVVRVQARADQLSADGAGTRVMYVRAPGEDDRHALSAIAIAAREPSELDGLSRLWIELPDAAYGDVQRWASFLIAPLELMRLPVPVAHSGRAAELARLSHARTFLRFGVGAMLVLFAIVVSVTLMRRGWFAAEEAHAIMDEALEGSDAVSPPQLVDRVRVVLWVLAVCMAFLAAALLIVAKPLWF